MSSDDTATEEQVTDADAGASLVSKYRRADETHRHRTTLYHATFFVSMLFVALVAEFLSRALIGRVTISDASYLLVVSVPFLAFGVWFQRLGDELSSLDAHRRVLESRLSQDAAVEGAPPDTGALPSAEVAGAYYLAFLLFATLGGLKFLSAFFG